MGGWINLLAEMLQDETYQVHFTADWVWMEANRHSFAWTCPAQENFEESVIWGMVHFKESIEDYIFSALPDDVRQGLQEWANSLRI